MTRGKKIYLSVLWLILACSVAALNISNFSWVGLLTTAIAWMGGIGTTLLFYESRGSRL